MKVGARSSDSMAEMRWVKICDKWCCKNEGFENEHEENALKNPENRF